MAAGTAKSATPVFSPIVAVKTDILSTDRVLSELDRLNGHLQNGHCLKGVGLNGCRIVGTKPPRYQRTIRIKEEEEEEEEKCCLVTVMNTLFLQSLDTYIRSRSIPRVQFVGTTTK